MDVIAFKCSKCGVEFRKDEGGVCAVCDRPFCADHLYEVKDGSNPKMLCGQDKGTLPGMLKKDPVLRIRRLLGTKKE